MEVTVYLVNHKVEIFHGVTNIIYAEENAPNWLIIEGVNDLLELFNINSVIRVSINKEVKFSLQTLRRYPPWEQV